MVIYGHHGSYASKSKFPSLNMTLAFHGPALLPSLLVGCIFVFAALDDLNVGRNPKIHQFPAEFHHFFIDFPSQKANKNSFYWGQTVMIQMRQGLKNAQKGCSSRFLQYVCGIMYTHRITPTPFDG